MFKIKVLSEAERDAAIVEQAAVGKVLVEVQDHKDEKFLVFDDPKPLSTDERLTALELRVAALEKKP